RATTAAATGNRTGRRRSGLARQGRRPHIEIVVVDVRFPTAIRGATRLRCVAGLTALLLLLRERVLGVPRPLERHDVARRIVREIRGRSVEGRTTTSSAPASSARRERRSGARAGVRRQHALPARRAGHEVDTRLVVAEIEVRERKLRRRVRAAHRRAKRGGELCVVECCALLQRLGVDDHELVAALDRASIPEAIGLADPARAVDDVDGEPVVMRIELRRASVVGWHALRRGARGDGGSARGDEQAEKRGAGRGHESHEMLPPSEDGASSVALPLSANPRYTVREVPARRYHPAAAVAVRSGDMMPKTRSMHTSAAALFAPFAVLALVAAAGCAARSAIGQAGAVGPTPSTSVAAPAAAGLAPTPPMGWNSWNKFGCRIDESLIRETADAMVSSGMKDAGYKYVN